MDASDRPGDKEGMTKSPAVTDGRRLRVMIVDDDPLIRDVVRTVLEDASYEIVEAADGAGALEAAARRRPDVVLLDIMMPGMDGYAVCRALRRDPALRGAIVVMLTAKSSPEGREQGLAAGADAYFTKPFSPLDLLRAIEGYTGTGRPSRAAVSRVRP